MNYERFFRQRLSQKCYEANLNKTCTIEELKEFINLFFQKLNVTSPQPRNAPDVWIFLEHEMYPRRDSLSVVVPVTIIYSILFVTGVIGNICTCFVIARNKYMHTATNYYLFNLAIADLLLLTVGLPPDLYTVWSLYPWIFGETGCIVRALFSEVSTNTSILTITAFTVERYVAICFPMQAQKMSSLHRAVRVIFSVWIIAICTAIPITIQYGVVKIKDRRNRTIEESAMCSLKELLPIPGTFQASTCLFFILPMIFISILYTWIAIAIRKSTKDSSRNEVVVKESVRVEVRAQQPSRGRRSVIKMLVAVVVAFFVCWAPFHAERMMTATIRTWTTPLLKIYRILFYLSGIFYFINCTINPILYSVMSQKFRQALRKTLFRPRCCRCPVKIKDRKVQFSKILHGNSHNETNSTYMAARIARGVVRKSEDLERLSEKGVQTSGSHSPTRSISGSSLKSTDGMSQEEDLQHALLQMKSLEGHHKTANGVISERKDRDIKITTR